jgi:hypothetical protein
MHLLTPNTLTDFSRAYIASCLKLQTRSFLDCRLLCTSNTYASVDFHIPACFASFGVSDVPYLFLYRFINIYYYSKELSTHTMIRNEQNRKDSSRISLPSLYFFDRVRLPDLRPNTRLVFGSVSLGRPAELSSTAPSRFAKRSAILSINM